MLDFSFEKVSLNDDVEFSLFWTDPDEPTKYENIDLKNCLSSEIIKGFKEVMKNKRKDLEDCIDPENGLLNRLYEQRIIEDSEIDNVRNITPYRDLNGVLLRKIDRKIENINEFIKALCQDDQDHIAKFIVTAGCETDSDERLLSRELRKVIDDNMFCLDKLMDTEKHDLVNKLVPLNCITSQHRAKVIRSKQEDRSHELLVILQRRRYKDFIKFIECLRKTMQKNIVKILEKGGVTEVQVQLYQERGDKRDIEVEVIRKLTCYVDGDTKTNELSEDQKKIVDELLEKLAENDIYFVGSCTGTSKNIVSVFLQGGKDDSLPVLQESCESGSLKNTLDKLFRSLFKIPEGSPPLVKMVTTGNHSNRHHATTATEQNSGEWIICFMFRHLLSSSQFNSLKIKRKLSVQSDKRGWPGYQNNHMSSFRKTVIGD